MANICYHNVGITALSACVPQRRIANETLTFIPKEELQKTIDSIGVKEKRYADADVCASDLCYKAARQLFGDNQIDPQTIDALIFVSQTPDYHQPATAPILQHRLGLPTTTLAFDINLACSGYVYGLSVAFALASSQGLKRVLLLVGETMSKVVSQHDKVSTPLFGDAGTATLIENGEYGDSFFSLNTDGSGSDVIKMPYGGYRQPSSIAGLETKVDVDGNERTGEQFFMNGLAVFNFGMSVEPRDIKNLIALANITIDEVDILVYHQANKMMTDFFSRFLKIPSHKTPYSIAEFGNTSSASIPLTIVAKMHEQQQYPMRHHVILSGFGAGLSWGSCLLSLEHTHISKLIEYAR